MDYSKVQYRQISVFQYPWYVLRRQSPAVVFAIGLFSGAAVAALAAVTLLSSSVDEAAAALPDEAALTRPAVVVSQAVAVDVPAKQEAKTGEKPLALAPLPQLEQLAELRTYTPAPPPKPTMPVVPLPPMAKPQPEVIRTQVAIPKGESIEKLLANYQMHEDDAEAVVAAMRRSFNNRDLKAGQKMFIALQPMQENGYRPLEHLRLHLSPTRELVVKPDGRGYKAESVEIDVDRDMVRLDAPVRSSFLQAAMDAGVPQKQLMELIQAFSYDIDFQRDLHPGDKLTVVMERLTNEHGEFVSFGPVLYARLKQRGRDVTLYRFESAKGQVGYYHEDGRSVRKGLMRTPVDGARISSGFGMRRHPILGYSKMHRGVDFAAPTGTPVYAAGDGVVNYAGPKGGYGNYIQISHSSGYATAYGHLHRIHHKLRQGSSVRQGQLIGYVGSTGRSTGPHLHYEILVNGSQVNPQDVKFAPQLKLAGKQLKQFRSVQQHIEAALDAAPGKPSKVAMAD